MQVQVFEPSLLPHVAELVNYHLSAAIPGWTLPADYIDRHLHTNPTQPVIDPWVIERKTLCVVEKSQVVGAAHLLRYGDDAVGEWYKNMADIAWVLFWPEHQAAGAALLSAAIEQMRRWGISGVYSWDSSLPVPLVCGVMDVWPHISALLTDAHFEPTPDRKEAIYGGWINEQLIPTCAPQPNITLHRTMQSSQGVAFTALHHNQKIGWCECITDLNKGGAIPTLTGWAELSNMFVEKSWRSKGIGSWLVAHAAEWLRMAGCNRIALSVAVDDEARGAGRFYERFGWKPFSRLQQGWKCTDFTQA